MQLSLVNHLITLQRGSDKHDTDHRARISNLIALLLCIMLTLQIPLYVAIWHEQGRNKLLIILMHMAWISSCWLLNRLRLYQAARLSLILGYISYLVFSCLIARDDVNSQLFFLMGVIVCPFLFSGAETRQLWAWVCGFISLFVYFQLFWFTTPQGLNMPVKEAAHLASLLPHFNLLFFAFTCLLASLAIRTVLLSSWSETKRNARIADQVLCNALPLTIVERLKKAPSTIADYHPRVSVLFCDISGFTHLCSQLSAPRVVTLLNELFSRFDMLAEANQVEKIKTNGDEYMVVAGAPHSRADDAARICQFALELRETFYQFCRQEQLPCGIRIGIATGEAIAGVIGVSRYSYDLWGQTVNLASSLETQAIEGRILVCQQTRNLLAQEFAFSGAKQVTLKSRELKNGYFLQNKHMLCSNYTT